MFFFRLCLYLTFEFCCPLTDHPCKTTFPPINNLAYHVSSSPVLSFGPGSLLWPGIVTVILNNIPLCILNIYTHPKGHFTQIWSNMVHVNTINTTPHTSVAATTVTESNELFMSPVNRGEWSWNSLWGNGNPLQSTRNAHGCSASLITILF